LTVIILSTSPSLTTIRSVPAQNTPCTLNLSYGRPEPGLVNHRFLM
jgi:hypothetical protein